MEDYNEWEQMGNDGTLYVYVILIGLCIKKLDVQSDVNSDVSNCIFIRVYKNKKYTISTYHNN